MKKIITLILAVGLLGMMAAPVFAQPHPLSTQLQIITDQLKVIQEKINQLRSGLKEIKEVKKETKEEVKNVKEAIKEELKEFKNIVDIPAMELKQHLSFVELGNGRVETLIKAGVITEIANDFIKVKIFNLEYKAVISSTSKVVRHYWGTSQLSEFAVGDVVNVYGFMNADDYTTIVVQTIRNVSIQKLHGVFQGEIKAISPPNTFTFETKERGSQTVITGSETKIFIGREKKSFADLQVGMTGLVRGIWDRTLSKIQALLIMMKPLPTTSPIPTTTPTVSPTPTLTVTPTVSPTPTPTVTPTVSPTPTPTVTPTESPTPTPTPAQ